MQKYENFNRALCSAVHTVVPGDTLYQIARQYGTDYQRLMMLNGIKNPYNIQPGQKICIPRNINYGDSSRPHKPHRPHAPHHSQMPDTQQTPSTPPAPQTPPQPREQQSSEQTREQQITEQTHEQQSSEQIREPQVLEQTRESQISEQTHEQQSSEMQPAQLPQEPAVSQENQFTITAYVSDSSADGIIYNITPGESLTSIQAKFGVCLEALKKENPDVDFSSDITGLTICIPYEDRYRKTCSRSFYAVKHDDTINTVARKTGITADGLLLLNPAYSPEDFSITGNLIRLI